MTIFPISFSKYVLRSRSYFLWLLCAWLIVIAVSGLVRPIFPSNELRYISVAWEMWIHHSFLVPVQGGLPYSHKPPLLFWCVHVGWALFGVNSVWPRLVPELFALASLGMVYAIARQLWPSSHLTAQLAPCFLLGMSGWLSQLGLFKFDIMMSFFTLLMAYCLIRALDTSVRRWWFGLALAVALGVLSKGPVCLLFMLPMLLLAPWWFIDRCSQHDIIKAVGALFLGLLLAMVWAVPAAVVGGKVYALSIFWHQSAGRIAGEYGGIKHWYAYFTFLFWLLFPWSLWLALWRSLWTLCKQRWHHQQDRGVRLLIAVCAPALILLSLIPTKSERYIVPLLPWLALLFAYAVANGVNQIKHPRRDRGFIAAVCVVVGIIYLCLPYVATATVQQRYFWLSQLAPHWGWGCACMVLGMSVALWRNKTLSVNVLGLMLTSITLFIVYNMALVAVITPYNDLRPMAKQLAQLEHQHRPIAMYRSDFEFDFFGRLQQPTVILTTPNALQQWVSKNPRGWVVNLDTSVFPAQYILRPVKWYRNHLQS